MLQDISTEDKMRIAQDAIQNEWNLLKNIDACAESVKEYALLHSNEVTLGGGDLDTYATAIKSNANRFVNWMN